MVFSTIRFLVTCYGSLVWCCGGCRLAAALRQRFTACPSDSDSARLRTTVWMCSMCHSVQVSLQCQCSTSQKQLHNVSEIVRVKLTLICTVPQVPSVDGKLDGQWVPADASACQFPAADPGDAAVHSSFTYGAMGSFWSREALHVPISPAVVGHGSYVRCPCTGWRPSTSSVDSVPGGTEADGVQANTRGRPVGENTGSAPCQTLQVLIDDSTSQLLERAVKASQLPQMPRPVRIQARCAQVPVWGQCGVFCFSAHVLRLQGLLCRLSSVTGPLFGLCLLRSVVHCKDCRTAHPRPPEYGVH